MRKIYFSCAAELFVKMSFTEEEKILKMKKSLRCNDISQNDINHSIFHNFANKQLTFGQSHIIVALQCNMQCSFA